MGKDSTYLGFENFYLLGTYFQWRCPQYHIPLYLAQGLSEKVEKDEQASTKYYTYLFNEKAISNEANLQLM